MTDMPTSLTRVCAFVLVVHMGQPILGAASPQPLQDAITSPRATRIVATDRFAFHSDPWINLHHFLYQWSREDRGLEIGRRPLPMPERSTVGELSAADRTAWLKVVAFYRDAVASRGNFDPEMMRMKARLVFLNGDPSAVPADVIPGIANALRVAMPIYLSRWWPRHDQANRRWINAVLPRLRRHEAAFVQLTTRVRESKWPAVPFRVDVTAYPNYRAGYTTSEGHIVMFSTDPGNQHLYSLEMLLHEVQHAEAIQGTMPTAIAKAFSAAGAEAPVNLWHALIFATAGEFVRSMPASEGAAAYVPYWIRELENVEGWKELVQPVSEYWLPVVRGEVTRAEGLNALARALGGR
jgi:hypothetical protein